MTKVSIPPKGDVGIIIGRFQVHELHTAHKALIDRVTAKHDQTMIFLGLSPLRNTINNPLDFNTRKRMINEDYPNIPIYYAEDNRDDVVWSKNLDREISKVLNPHQIPILYGSRDSFISHYQGKFTVVELESDTFISGTEIRRRIANNHPPTKDFRAGVISASFSRFPVSYTAVDVVIVDWDKQRILLGKKKNEPHFRFIGGFAEPSDSSFEETGKREVQEEAGLDVENLQYIGSFLIDDWRFRKEEDKIKSVFFMADYTSGRPTAGDDIEEVKWFTMVEICDSAFKIMPEHKALLEDFFLKHNINLPSGETKHV